MTGRYKPSNQSAGQPFIIPQLSLPPGETWRVVFNKLHMQTENLEKQPSRYSQRLSLSGSMNIFYFLLFGVSAFSDFPERNTCCSFNKVKKKSCFLKN